MRIGRRSQIAGWLRNTYPDDVDMRVSTETIYRSLFLQARGVLKRELLSHLRRHRVMRCSKHATMRGAHRTLGIPNAVSIRDRPAAVETRAVPGHWESQCCCQAAGVSAARRGSR